jgi:hypothetical protein
MQEISTVIFFVTHTVSERNRVGCKWFALQTKGAPAATATAKSCGALTTSMTEHFGPITLQIDKIRF